MDMDPDTPLQDTLVVRNGTNNTTTDTDTISMSVLNFAAPFCLLA